MKNFSIVFAFLERLPRRSVRSAWFVAVATALAVAPAARSQNSVGTIRVRTDLVDILASVTNANGEPVLGLARNSFHLSEDGVPQTIERFEPETNRPLDLALMIDASMSTMIDMRFETQAASHFIRQVVRPGDSLGVFEFDQVVTQLGEFSDNVPRLQAALRHIRPGAGTSIYDAIVLGSNALSQRPEGRRRAIVLVTDAGETTSESSFDQARHAAIAADALLYSIIIRPIKGDIGRNTAGEHALITITDSTGGAMFILNNPHQLNEMFNRIDRQLRTQYLLGYYPHPIPPAGSERHVHLMVKGGYTVHYKKEYFAGGAPQ